VIQRHVENGVGEAIALAGFLVVAMGVVRV
jgi:hypothetical protein